MDPAGTNLVLLVAAFVCFVIASFTAVPRVNLIAAGLALVTLAKLVA